MALTAPFGGRFDGCRVLVTGHTGFKGSWLALWLQRLGAVVGGVALDPEGEPSHWNALGLRLALDARADLRDADAIARVVDGFRPELVIHLAAQSLVRRSYRDPSATFAANVTGLVNLFEAVRRSDSVRAIVNATTDKVYEPPSPTAGYREDAPLGGHDPYSASKACAEIVSASYRRCFFQAGDAATARVALATARAGNVIGGGDWAEDRLVPDLVRAAMHGEALRLRNPEAVRPWQHVLEPLSGYLWLSARLLDGERVAEAWNFGPAADATLSVAELVARLHARWPGTRVEIDPPPHPHESPRLLLDCSKAADRLGWRPAWNAETTLERTLRWYRGFASDGTVSSADDIDAYVRDARDAGVAWAA
jgi:CDP-glucose 4,6-dehydratase